MKVWEFVDILLSAVVAGMFLGPWVALTRSIGDFEPAVFLAILHRLNRDMAPVMTVLMPVSLLSAVPVLLLSYGEQPRTFYLTLAGLALFVVALLVTVLIEVPAVKEMTTWTGSALPAGWEQVRDRWGKFHLVRIAAALIGLALLLAAVIF